MPVTFPRQASFRELCPVSEAVEKLATEGGVGERGAIYTRREVVDFILDLTGYTGTAALTDFRLLEPSFGEGDFLLPVVDRLLMAAARDGRLTYENLADAVRAVELHRPTFEATRARVAQRLQESGLLWEEATRLCDVWLYQGDFLLSGFDMDFTHVVGNPPYVRQEAIPDVLINEYRQRYKTIYDRADIYVPFIERSLTLLSQGGTLGFICADRWMKNKYGKKLRELVARDYSLKVHVDMVDTNAFHSEVSAYPAITVICKDRSDVTRVFARPLADAAYLSNLAAHLTAARLPADSQVREVRNAAGNSDPWVLGSFDDLALVRRLEERFLTLEEAGCKVGIGVATGADKAFIGDFEMLDVEPSRKLPLAMTGDIVAGTIDWRGKGIINPFADDGKLVDLNEYPRLRAYLEERREQILRRHVAQKNPRNWYRTIDRIYPELTRRKKLLIPDIKGDASIVYEEGKLYPHHNLYFITSDEWDILALQAIMRSGIARLFVGLYCTRMRGGYMRFQAQYLRKIRIPKWSGVSVDLREKLALYAETNNISALNDVVSEIYALSPEELKLVERTGDV